MSMERQPMKNSSLERKRNEALSISLCFLAEQLGYTVTGKGRVKSLKEMDSLKIFDDRTWYRFSRSKGGSQIDFMLEFGGCQDFKEAVERIIELSGKERVEERPSDKIQQEKTRQEIDKDRLGSFELPKAAENYKRAAAYLHEKRGLSYKIIEFMISKGILYEEQNHHNLVFVGRDTAGKARYASLRGTLSFGLRFCGEVDGSDKRYGVSLVNPESEKLIVFESTIDMMSYMELKKDWKNNMLALGGVAAAALEQFLTDYPHIRKIQFSLDADKAGRKALYGEKEREGFMRIYSERGYETSVVFPSMGKDWNDELLMQHT